MKTLKHIWSYLSDPVYRHMVDLVAAQEAQDICYQQIVENLRETNHPLFIVPAGTLKEVTIGKFELDYSQIVFKKPLDK